MLDGVPNHPQQLGCSGNGHGVHSRFPIVIEAPGVAAQDCGSSKMDKHSGFPDSYPAFKQADNFRHHIING